MNEHSPNNITWKSWLDAATVRISWQDACSILLDVIGGEVDASWLVLHGDEFMDKKARKIASRLVENRASGMPLAYVLGHKFFYGYDFWLGDGPGKVLIPRPETEIAIDMIKKMRPHSIVDVGTGSGCIAITLALEMPELDVIGVDISENALAVARKNAGRLGVVSVARGDSRSGCLCRTPHVCFFKSNLLENVPKRYDVVVANLPYVDKNWEWLDEKALSYEPGEALYADSQGLSLIKSLIIQATERGVRHLFLEADPLQHHAIIAYAKQYHLAELIGFWMHLVL